MSPSVCWLIIGSLLQIPKELSFNQVSIYMNCTASIWCRKPRSRIASWEIQARINCEQISLSLNSSWRTSPAQAWCSTFEHHLSSCQLNSLCDGFTGLLIYFHERIFPIPITQFQCYQDWASLLRCHSSLSNCWDMQTGYVNMGMRHLQIPRKGVYHTIPMWCTC